MTTEARSWCFTLNNPTEAEVLVPQSWETDRYKYLVYQLEQGEQGTRHLQGYISFKSPIRFATFRKWFPDERGHIEVARGSAKQNRKYCTKAEGRLEGPWEFGSLPEQGKRNDLLAVKEALDSGATVREVAGDHFSTYVRYNRGIERYKYLLDQDKPAHIKEVICLYGSTGVGKTRWAYEHYPSAYWKSRSVGTSQWWDGLDGHDAIIVDEFYGWFPWDFILRLTDRYPLNMEVKGGTIRCPAKTIVFTSNKHPKDWYPNSKYLWDDSNPLRRRFTKIIEMLADGTQRVERDVAIDAGVATGEPSLAESRGPLPTGMANLRSINDVLGRGGNDERVVGSANTGNGQLAGPTFRNGLPAPVATDYGVMSDTELGIGC